MTISIRLTDKEAGILETLSRRTGRSKSQIVRDAIARARPAKSDSRREAALALAGSLSGPRNLSTREGFGKQ